MAVTKSKNGHDQIVDFTRHIETNLEIHYQQSFRDYFDAI